MKKKHAREIVLIAITGNYNNNAFLGFLPLKNVQNFLFFFSYSVVIHSNRTSGSSDEYPAKKHKVQLLEIFLIFMAM